MATVKWRRLKPSSPKGLTTIEVSLHSAEGVLREVLHVLNGGSILRGRTESKVWPTMSSALPPWATLAHWGQAEWADYFAIDGVSLAELTGNDGLVGLGLFRPARDNDSRLYCFHPRVGVVAYDASDGFTRMELETTGWVPPFDAGWSIGSAVSSPEDLFCPEFAPEWV